MKIRTVSLLLVPVMLVAQQTSVPVEDEPLHKVMFRNDSVIVMHVIIAPRETTQFHTHSHDRAVIDLSSTEIAQQKINEPEGPKTPTKLGNFSALERSMTAR